MTKFLAAQIVISDPGSTNGTFLNSHPDRLVKDKQYLLRDGDVIKFGFNVSTIFSFVWVLTTYVIA